MRNKDEVEYFESIGFEAREYRYMLASTYYNPIIYTITNLVNGKKFIGLIVHMKEAIESMKKSAKLRRTELQKDMSKYGIDNFDIEIEVLDNNTHHEAVEILNEKILKENTLRPNGYNFALRKPRGRKTIKKKKP